MKLSKEEVNRIEHELLNAYFHNYSFLKLTNIRFNLIYKDNKLLKSLFFDKKYYRSYYLNLYLDNEIKHQSKITYKDKNYVKRNIHCLYSYYNSVFKII